MEQEVAQDAEVPENDSALVVAAVAALSINGAASAPAFANYVFTFTEKILHELIMNQIEEAEKSEQVKQQDEIGKLTKWLNIFFEKLQILLQGVHGETNTIKEINEHIQHASLGLAEINESINRNTIASLFINDESDGVTMAATEIVDRGRALEKLSEDLNRMAASLKQLAGTFKI